MTEQHAGRTHYPPGVSGAAVMQETAGRLRAALQEFCASSDIDAQPIDNDMLTLTISGMHARYLLTRMHDAGLI